MITGRDFVGRELGASRLVLTLSDSALDNGPTITVSELIDRVDRSQAKVNLSSDTWNQLCPFSENQFDGKAHLETVSNTTGRLYRSQSLRVFLECRREIRPTLNEIPINALYLNDAMRLPAIGILLGEAEGTTTAVIRGCVLARGVTGECTDSSANMVEREIELKPEGVSREQPILVVGPEIVGLEPGFFEGSLSLKNQLPDGRILESETQDFFIQMQESFVESVGVHGSSLGGRIEFSGRGLLGANEGELTTMVMEGSFETLEGEQIEISSEVVLEYSSSDVAYYILNEEDDIGRRIKMRKNSGVFVGRFTPILSHSDEERELNEINSSFEVKPIRQIVFVNFLPGFDDALERFGLFSAGELIRQQIITRAAEFYAGVGLELRTDPPEDYSLYAQVELTGFDPNGIGLMGYDNTPGKDSGNERLYDRIGGVHAVTQEDGYPGYGGVFVESFFGFSTQPPPGIEAHPGASPIFDRIFNPLRPSTGQPANFAEISAFVPIYAQDVCGAVGLDRQMQVNCGIVILSNLISSTMAHEIAHSLGLADPEGSLFHNPQPQPHFLMDAGGERPFEERARLTSMTGEYFCFENYEYLRAILPTSLPDPLTDRAVCY